MRYFGLFIIVFAAAAVSWEYAKHMKKRFRECEGFLFFFEHMRIGISSFLHSPRKLSEGFSSDALRSVGFLPALAESDDVLEAYKKAEGSLSLSREERGVIEELFSSVGSCYLSDALRLIDRASEKMKVRRAALAAEYPKNVRLFTSISVTCALGIVILLI
ncbi:MAG: stage III sporulation protein AB [Clostridia bacterium]|nr:stage III sporulation protein AB [Clostridia bacterium]